jgi:hypothetical protein
VEVGDEGVDELKVVPRLDEQCGLAAARQHVAARVDGQRFERSNGCRPDRDDAARLASGATERRRGGRRDGEPLRIDAVLLDSAHLHWFERPVTDVQRHFGALDTCRCEFVQLIAREMKAGGRRGHRAVLRSVDRLIALLVLQ